MARSVWALADEEIVEVMCQNESDNAKDWIFQMNSKLSHDQLVRMVITLWAIWGARRKAVYEDIFQSPMSTHLYIQSYWSDLQVLKKPHIQHSQARPARPSNWIQPPENLMKVNVDAAVRGRRGVGSVAAICRNRQGLYISRCFIRGIQRYS